MKCQKCDNPATLHVTEVVDGNHVGYSLCETHAGEFQSSSGMPAEQKSVMSLFWDPEVSRILSDGESRQRMSAYLLPTLCVALTDEEPGVRVLAALGMLFLGSDARSALSAVRDALNDDDHRVRKVAEVVLRCIEQDTEGQ